MYKGHIHKPTIILEAVASNDLWFWHIFFGMPGSHNDINVLERSNLFSDLVEGRAPPANYKIGKNPYTHGYYLTYGIYPTWSTFVKTIPYPRGEKYKYFAKQQEAARKDVERAFGVLQARFAIVQGPARFWNHDDLIYIMRGCIIMHNMIVEDERGNYAGDFVYDENDVNPPVEISREHTAAFDEILDMHMKIRDGKKHSQLQKDLIEHLWARRGESSEDVIANDLPSSSNDN